MRKYTLSQAIQIIASVHQIPSHSITKCQFEDGSGYKFNYSYFNRQGAHTHFIDLSSYNFPAVSWQQTLYNIYAVLSVIVFLIGIGLVFMGPKGVAFPINTLVFSILNFLPLYIIGTFNKLIK